MVFQLKSRLKSLLHHPSVWTGCSCSDRENCFWRAGQIVRQAFGALPDILSPCQTFSQLRTSKYQWSFLFYLSDILSVLNPVGQNVRQGLSSLPDISRSLPDMSGMSSIFRDHCSWSSSVCLNG